MSEGGDERDLCPECGGRGWVIAKDGGAGIAKPCSCRQTNLVPRLLERAGIPRRYAGCTLEKFTVEAPDPAKKDNLLKAHGESRLYVDGFLREGGGFLDHGLLFVGPPGVGKTHLAAAVLTELIRRYRVRGLFVDFTSLIHRIQSTFDPTSPESKREVLDPVTDAEFLVLDELGAQKPTEWVRDTLYLVINTRYTRQLPTLFTTNYELAREENTDAAPGMSVRREPLAERIGASLLSRIYEMAKPVMIRANDFRREVKSHSAHLLSR